MTIERQREAFIQSILTPTDRTANKAFHHLNSALLTMASRKVPQFNVVPVGPLLTENVLLHAPGEPAPTTGDAWIAEGMATEDHVIRAWVTSWPFWTWHEFRGAEAEWVRDLLSGAHASMLHAGDVVCVRPDPWGHGDHEALCHQLYN